MLDLASNVNTTLLVLFAEKQVFYQDTSPSSYKQEQLREFSASALGLQLDGQTRAVWIGLNMVI